MRYLGFDNNLGLMKTLSFGVVSDSSKLPNLIILMTKSNPAVDPKHVDFNMVLPAKEHPYQ